MQITTKDLTFIFDKGMINEHLALKKINLKISQGEFITIIGQSGSGKTTLIEHFNALLIPTFGSITIGDKKIVHTKRKIKNIKSIRKNIGVVFQFAEYQLFEDTILKDIIFGPLSMGVDKKVAIKRAKKYLNLVGLEEDFLTKSPFSLSGGQKRRVALAGILAMEPEVLVFDEPTAGLDPHGEIDMYKIFNKLHKSGKTIIIVTHNLDHVLQYSNRTIILDDGVLVEDGLSIDLMYNQTKLIKYNLELPKIPALVLKLEQNCLKIGKVKSLNDLTNAIKKNKEQHNE